MLFESCNVDPRSGNILTSPEFTLQSDQELTFTMQSPSDGNDHRLAVYQAQGTRHPSLMLGTYSSGSLSLDGNTTSFPSESNSANSTNSTNNANETYSESSSSSFSPYFVEATHNICLPSGTYQLVFIAGNAGNVAQLSTAAVRDVFLTGVSCTYSQPSGKQ